jgi:hypothetical protein
MYRCKCTDVPLNTSAQGYIVHLECFDFEDPRNMPHVPVIQQLGNVPVPELARLSFLRISR